MARAFFNYIKILYVDKKYIFFKNNHYFQRLSLKNNQYCGYNVLLLISTPERRRQYNWVM